MFRFFTKSELLVPRVMPETWLDPLTLYLGLTEKESEPPELPSRAMVRVKTRWLPFWAVTVTFTVLDPTFSCTVPAPLTLAVDALGVAVMVTEETELGTTTL